MKDEYEKCASYKMQIENVVRLKKLKKSNRHVRHKFCDVRMMRV